MIEQAVILAGGLGTRLMPFTEENPKPMYPFNGIPFVEYLVKQVKGFGINRILILLGYLPDKIKDYLGDGSNYGVQIIYDVTPVEYNTGDRLLHAESKIDDTFLLMYCDNFCPIDYQKLESDFRGNNALIQVSVYENRDGYTKSNLLIANSGRIDKYDKKRITPNLQGVDIGYALIQKEVFKYVKDIGCNFEAAVYPNVVKEQRMYATITKHRYYSVGSWERIELTRQFFAEQPTVFLDRDGTLNVKAPKACYIETPKQFVWLEGAKEAVRLLKEAGFRVILVTNQPGIARGNLSEDDLARIHEKLQDDLKESGAALDKIYYCPHNWDEGCECRKPKPGMLYQAQKDFSLNLTKCYMIGDDERDIEAGGAAGCKCIMVSEEYPLLYAVKDILERKREDV